MIGKTLGHYRVGEQLGRGGMGEVYLADDLNLNRKVALKFLPDAFATDPERMARFEREAKLLASLNHPNIAAIYGLEQAEGKRFLVLELVEGETLAQRLSKGPLPLEEALGICRQIAEALEAAHEKGVIHRDLKPANVMITEGDKVKILDFGLAKALSDETQSVDSSQSPTLTEAMTRPGVILGTAAYMSPEQAKGKAVDKRADIWAFGCILYECLTGKRAFEGETITETLAAILKGEPDWQASSATTPPSIRFVLRRCLEKDMSRRLRDAADIRIQIDEAHEIGEATFERTSTKRLWLAWGAAALFLLTTLIVSLMHFGQKPSVAEPMLLQIVLPSDLPANARFALSPDGRCLAFANGERLWVRTLNSLEDRALCKRESGQSTPPRIFWSPDSRFIAFDDGGKLKKIAVTGGPAQTICSSAGDAVGGSWNRDGVIILGTQGGGLMRVAATGSTAFAVTKPNPASLESQHVFPAFLPDGRHFLYLCVSGIPEKQGIYIGSLDSKPEEQDSKQLVATNFAAVYVPSQDSGLGQLLFLREEVLLAQQFDERRLELVGEPLPVAERVGSYSNYGYFSASTNGLLIYRSGVSWLVRLTWYDRQGKVLGTAGETAFYNSLTLSPDGERAAVSWGRPEQPLSSSDIWLLDFAQGTNTRFTFGQGDNRLPVWSPDGSRIVFASNRDGGVYNLYQKLASGAKEEEPLLKSSENKYPSSWSSDGRFLLYSVADPKAKGDLWVLPLEGDRKPIPFLRTEFVEADGHFSPDMRWVAYTSSESGSREIYVRGFSKTSGGASSESAGKWLISNRGGMRPQWRRDGKELYYRALDGKVMAVEVISGTAFKTGTPKPLIQATPDIFAGSLAGRSLTWDATPDGNRFLLSTPAAESSPSPFTVVLNWTALLKK